MGIVFRVVFVALNDDEGVEDGREGGGGREVTSSNERRLFDDYLVSICGTFFRARARGNYVQQPPRDRVATTRAPTPGYALSSIFVAQPELDLSCSWSPLLSLFFRPFPASCFARHCFAALNAS